MMKSIWPAVFLMLSLPVSATTNDLNAVAVSFPSIAVWEYRPDVAVQTANRLITSDPSIAIAALEAAAKAPRPFREKYDVNQRLCHLCRLIFVPTNETDSLRPPMLGSPGLLPYMSMRPSDWPYMPFAIINDVPLSMTIGYSLAGRPETATDYLTYCKNNGVFRTKPYPVPTALTASNALHKLFDSWQWRSLKWKGSGAGWSYTINEEWAKESLERQIQNMRTNVPTVRTTARP